MKCVLKHQDMKTFVFKLNKYCNFFQPLEVFGNGSKTQLQVAEDLNKLI